MEQYAVEAAQSQASGPHHARLKADALVPGGHGPGMYLIGEAAALTGVSPDALRKWERLGLIDSQRRPGGQRRYGEDDLARIRLIARSQDAQHLSRRTIATLLESGALRPNSIDYAPVPARQPAPQRRQRRARPVAAPADSDEPLRARRLFVASGRIGQATLSTGSLPEILEVICREARQAFDATDSAVWLLNAHLTTPNRAQALDLGAACSLVPSACSGPHTPEVLRRSPIRLRPGEARALVTPCARALDRWSADAGPTSSRIYAECAAVVPGATLLLAPLCAPGDQMLGMLALWDAQRSERFDDRDVEIVELFAAQAALALATARLRVDHETSRQRAEAATQDAARRADQLAAILETLPDPVYLYDAREDRLHTNAAGRQQMALLAGPDAPATPDALARFLQPHDAQGRPLGQEHWPATRMLAGEVLDSAHAYDLVLRTFEGRDICISITGAPLRDATGRIVGMVAVCRDVTERRQLEQHLAVRASAPEATGPG